MADSTKNITAFLKLRFQYDPAVDYEKEIKKAADQEKLNKERRAKKVEQYKKEIS